MLRPMGQRRESFLVSLWLEPDSNEEHILAWRGSVVHLVTQQRRYFTELVDLVAFLAAFAGTPGRGDGDPR